MTAAASTVYAGIMSGTSLDGIDVVFAEFEGRTIRLRGHYEEAYPQALVELLSDFSHAESLPADTLFRVDTMLAQRYAAAVHAGLNACGLKAEEVCVIGLHGQTIRHLPKPQAVGELGTAAATVQLGCGPAVAALTGIDVVYDFRSADVALGGQGAPLVPMFDKYFLSSETADRLIVNIGGMANVTWLAANNADVLAFDTGPGNVLIDLLMREFYNLRFDSNGERARAGKIVPDLLEHLLAHPYFAEAPPKSTGRELFNLGFVNDLVTAAKAPGITAEDVLATATELTAATIAGAFDFLERTANPCEVIVSGGGARNTYLMERLAAQLQAAGIAASIIRSDDLGIPSQQKEALAFAWFAKARLEQKIIHLPKTTGASRSVMLGSVACA